MSSSWVHPDLLVITWQHGRIHRSDACMHGTTDACKCINDKMHNGQQKCGWHRTMELCSMFSNNFHRCPTWRKQSFQYNLFQIREGCEYVVSPDRAGLTKTLPPFYRLTSQGTLQTCWHDVTVGNKTLTNPQTYPHSVLDVSMSMSLCEGVFM